MEIQLPKEVVVLLACLVTVVYNSDVFVGFDRPADDLFSGDGQTFASFSFSSLLIPSSIKAGDNLTGSVVVSNNGTADGEEVVEVYISWLNASLPAPKNQLAWFDRVAVTAGHQLNVSFLVQASSMALWINNQCQVPIGFMELYAGDQLPNQQGTGLSNVLFQKFYVHA